MPEIHLTRLTGFERGKRVRFDSSPIVLGTDASCSLRFDPTWDKTVSARHATLTWTGKAWTLTDESQAGCWINGQRVQGSVALEALTEIELGQGGPRVKVEQSVAPASVPAASAPPPRQPQTHPPTSPGNPVPPNLSETPGVSKNKFLIPLVAVIVLLVFGGIAAIAAFALARRAADEALAEMAQEYEEAVGVVVLQGDEGPVPFGTAWALGDHVLATNSHVAEPVGQILAGGGEVSVVLNRHPEKTFRVTQAVVHPQYESGLINEEGVETAVPAFDVGLLVVEEKLPVAFRIASKSELRKLRSGSRVAYLGFPSEGMAGGGVDPRNPVATMQSGIVTSVTDWWLGKADFDKALLVQHNLGATGGASGSPIFTPKGEVVALLSAGNIIGQVKVDPADGSVEVIRAPSAAMVNFGQRADLLEEFIDKAKSSSP